MPNDCLPSDHRYSKRVGSVAIFTLAWQFLTDNSSPDIFVDMVLQLLPQPKTTPCEGAWQHASMCVRKLKYKNLFWRQMSHLCENLHHQKFPAIRYLCRKPLQNVLNHYNPNVRNCGWLFMRSVQLHSQKSGEAFYPKSVVGI